MNSITKKCTKCGVEKSVDDFHYQEGRSLSRASHCKDCRNTSSRQYKKDHRDDVRVKERERYAANLERERARTLNYYNTHKVERAATHKERMKSEGFREKKGAAEATRRNALREKVFEILGCVCCKCGFSDKRALQIDHIYGNGYAERKKLNQSSIYQKVIEVGKKEYQMLCANCNWIKRIENGENARGKKWA